MEDCPFCDARIDRSARVCPKCGEILAPFCESCGTSIDWDWKNCPNCGKGLPAEKLLEQKNKIDEQARKLRSSYLVELMNYAEGLYDSGKRAKAKGCCKKALRYDSENAWAKRLLAKIEAEKKPATATDSQHRRLVFFLIVGLIIGGVFILKELNSSSKTQSFGNNSSSTYDQNNAEYQKAINCFNRNNTSKFAADSRQGKVYVSVARAKAYPDQILITLSGKIGNVQPAWEQFLIDPDTNCNTVNYSVAQGTGAPDESNWNASFEGGKIVLN